MYLHGNYMMIYITWCMVMVATCCRGICLLIDYKLANRLELFQANKIVRLQQLYSLVSQQVEHNLCRPTDDKSFESETSSVFGIYWIRSRYQFIWCTLVNSPELGWNSERSHISCRDQPSENFEHQTSLPLMKTYIIVLINIRGQCIIMLGNLFTK